MNHWKLQALLLGACVSAFAQSQPAPDVRLNSMQILTGQSVSPVSLANVFSTALATAVSQADTVPGSTTYALPHIAYGGGWYAAVYVTNPTDSAAAVTVRFTGEDGAPMSVPLVGIGPVSEYNVNLAARSTVILEAPNSGDLKQGWAQVVLPQGVIAYGVFRQSVQGRADQEAVVPLSGLSSQIAEMTWDEVGFNTAVAVVNAGDSAGGIAISSYASDGTLIGTTNVNLPAKGKTAFVLRTLPGLAGMTSRRGFARFSVTSGSVAALGLRFAAEAFTSIPVSYR